MQYHNDDGLAPSKTAKQMNGYGCNVNIKHSNATQQIISRRAHMVVNKCSSKLIKAYFIHSPLTLNSGTSS